MTNITKDPLLTIARILLIFFIGILGFAMVMIGIGIGALLTVERAEMMTHLADNSAPDGLYWALIGVLLLVEGLLALAMRFVFELRGIVLSVNQGDPFQPENASRLSRMGWIAVGGQLLAVVVGGLAVWVAQYAADEADNIDIDTGFSGGGILLILVLFILARVFRKGTELREEIEGTV